jgi:hypothetical protein
MTNVQQAQAGSYSVVVSNARQRDEQRGDAHL